MGKITKKFLQTIREANTSEELNKVMASYDSQCLQGSGGKPTCLDVEEILFHNHQGGPLPEVGQILTAILQRRAVPVWRQEGVGLGLPLEVSEPWQEIRRIMGQVNSVTRTTDLWQLRPRYRYSKPVQASNHLLSDLDDTIWQQGQLRSGVEGFHQRVSPGYSTIVTERARSKELGVRQSLSQLRPQLGVVSVGQEGADALEIIKRKFQAVVHLYFLHTDKNLLWVGDNRFGDVVTGWLLQQFFPQLPVFILNVTGEGLPVVARDGNLIVFKNYDDLLSRRELPVGLAVGWDKVLG